MNAPDNKLLRALDHIELQETPLAATIPYIRTSTENQGLGRTPSDAALGDDKPQTHAQSAPPPMSGTAGAEREIQQPALQTRWIDRGTLIPNLQNPRSYPRRQKITIVVIVAIASFSAPFASNIIMPSFPFIGPALKLNSTGVSLTTTMFLTALGIGPLYHAFLSERFGRRPIYIAGFVLYTFASVACALAPTGKALVGFRFVQAFGSSAAQSIGIGTISDIYIPAERGRATGFWFLGPILGPMVSPIVGGAIYSWLGWRAILWATAIFGVVLTGVIVLFLPETSLKLKAKHAAPPPTPKTLTPTSPKSVAINVAKGSYLYCIRPLGTIFYLGSPAIGLTALYSSVCFASLYAISVSTPFLFSKPPYQLDSVDISFLYLPACVGYCIGSVAGGYLSDREIRKAKAQFGDSYAPEVRLLSARWGVPLLPAGLLIFGWGLHRHTHLALPMVGGFIFGVGLMLTNGTIMAYFSDAVPGQTASVVAAYNALRNVFAGLIAALTTVAIKSGIQDGWYMTILALACLLFSVNLEVVQRMGPRWRRRRSERSEIPALKDLSPPPPTAPNTSIV